MSLASLSCRHIVFWTLAIALLSSISTVIFSETIVHDSVAAMIILISLIGLLYYGALRLVKNVYDICNP